MVIYAAPFSMKEVVLYYSGWINGMKADTAATKCQRAIVAS
jgi:hypothetical protein